MARKTYWVSPDGDKWKVKVEGGERATRVFDTKDEAIHHAVELARNAMPSQVLIQKQDGQIQDERTYGDDPFPPRG